MLRTKYIITNRALTLALSFGLTVAWPCYSSAASAYTFSFDGSNLFAGIGNTLDGSFSIPVSDFTGSTSNGSTITLPNADISALNFTLVYTGTPPNPSGSISFGLSDLYTTPTPLTPSVTFTFESGLPQITSGIGSLAANSDGAFGLTCCGGATVTYPGAFGPATTDDGGVWVTSATPLPSTWTMLIAGFVGLGFFAYRGTKNSTAVTTAA